MDTAYLYIKGQTVNTKWGEAVIIDVVMFGSDVLLLARAQTWEQWIAVDDLEEG